MVKSSNFRKTLYDDFSTGMKSDGNQFRETQGTSQARSEFFAPLTFLFVYRDFSVAVPSGHVHFSPFVAGYPDPFDSSLQVSLRRIS
jgi:hypothetical protein